MDWHCAYGGGAYAFFLWIILHWFIILCRSAMCFQLHCIVISRFHCGTIHERYTSSDIPARTARWTPQPWASKQPSFSCLFVCSLVKTVYIKNSTWTRQASFSNRDIRPQSNDTVSHFLRFSLGKKLIGGGFAVSCRDSCPPIKFFDSCFH